MDIREIGYENGKLPDGSRSYPIKIFGIFVVETSRSASQCFHSNNMSSLYSNAGAMASNHGYKQWYPAADTTPSVSTICTKPHSLASLV